MLQPLTCQTLARHQSSCCLTSCSPLSLNHAVCTSTGSLAPAPAPAHLAQYLPPARSETSHLGHAIDAVSYDGGLLYLTSTDGFSSGGLRPARSLAAYGAYLRALPYANEQVRPCVPHHTPCLGAPSHWALATLAARGLASVAGMAMMVRM